ncbi:mannose-1-phosphate guanylyltransferase/mannose-6-phosphate isomerase [Terrihabitans soli]|uniref:mannose-1-phosphate guanylyltransferase n=1 Tax=Terrihabitans soli TaxID=708113 RepID=A0A6S6QY10_9HYPH|nr:mannose-1-phosphate guanylyltransferase/mannose-6-phosphate isomerase [Terrihabitans soli]BCJ91940.1 mannose-1-phosphate guanylyltransferase/mannose-6-phosphate isomerase [Terrihabitans soli]
MVGLIVPLILSGGAGTRLWPASRETRPKQFLSLFGPRSTFQETVRRVGPSDIFTAPVIMTNRDHRFLVSEQLREIGVAGEIILEPLRRDSGPAIAAGASFAASKYGPDAIVLVLAADHVVRKPNVFVDACRQAAALAQAGRIVTFGIPPDHASTAYGYIKPGIAVDGSSAHRIAAFVEKPDAETAQTYIAEGYLWNSGNFMFRADMLLQEYARFDAASVEAAKEAVAKSTPDLNFKILDQTAFSRAKAISIDYAVMEKTEEGAVLKVDMGWSDVGGWEAVWALSDKDESGNVLLGPTKAASSKNNLIMSDKVMTAAIGVSDLAIITTEDAVLVGRKSDSAALKAMVGEIRQSRPNLTESGARVYRPWGSYQSLDSGERYQVKRIVVTPGGQLSLQKHFHRSEHWIVVKGTAKVQIADQQRMVHENESVYIPIGSLHRLENPGKIDLELIEVQTGSYLGEDDIVRLEDVYNRAD